MCPISSSPTAPYSLATRTRIRPSPSWLSHGARRITFSSVCGVESCDGSAHEHQMGVGGGLLLGTAACTRRRADACPEGLWHRSRSPEDLPSWGPLAAHPQHAAAPARECPLR